MAWPNPFHRYDKNTRTAWEYTFQWTSQHSTPEQMHPLKFSYDTLGEEALNRINAIAPPLGKDLPRNNSRQSVREKGDVEEDAKPKRDLYCLLQDNAEKDETLGHLWKTVNTIPEWVDWGQIERGQEVFYRYGGPALTGLAYQSLLGGMVNLHVWFLSNIELSHSRELLVLSRLLLEQEAFRQKLPDIDCSRLHSISSNAPCHSSPFNREALDLPLRSGFDCSMQQSVSGLWP
jgi:hypothetical protein